MNLCRIVIIKVSVRTIKLLVLWHILLPSRHSVADKGNQPLGWGESWGTYRLTHSLSDCVISDCSLLSTLESIRLLFLWHIPLPSRHSLADKGSQPRGGGESGGTYHLTHSLSDCATSDSLLSTWETIRLLVLWHIPLPSRHSLADKGNQPLGRGWVWRNSPFSDCADCSTVWFRWKGAAIEGRLHQFQHRHQVALPMMRSVNPMNLEYWIALMG